jgi:hypothetical protein
MKQQALLGARICALHAVLAISLGGCAPWEEDTGTAASAVINFNSLSPAAIDPSSGAVSLPLLAGSALDLGKLAPAALAAIQDPSATGALSRRLLYYTVGCAFDPSQSFAFSWVDASNVTHDESYAGLLALETGWAGGPLGDTGQRWVSACLASRLNYFRVQVALSSRAAVLASGPDEIADFPSEEGAFWGNVFTSPPTAYACDDTPDDANSRSLQRVCAAGYVNAQGTTVGCGILQRVGPCSAACAPLTGDSGQYHPSCGGDGLTSEVITVFLE